MTRNMKSLFRTICLSLIAMILLTFGACSLDHGQIPGDQLETYDIVFIFDDAEGNLVAEKVVEVSKGKTIRTSQIPLIKETLEREGYIVPESYSVYWVLLNKEKQPINLDPTADVNNLENITSDICDNEGKVYVQTAYRKIGGAVTFFSNGGTPVQSIVGLEEGTSLSEHKPADPTKVGYTFVGWFNKELTEEFNWNTTLPAEGVDLYAKWEANKETAYVVEYYFEQLDGNYSLEETEKLSAATEELVSVKALEFEGFTHNPKHAEAKLEGNVLPDGSLVLKAYYTRNEYTVSFDVDGGEEKVEQTYKYGETLELGSTTKTGYTFLGWLLEGKELTHRTMPAQDLELVANWTVSTGIEYRIEHYFEELDGTYAKDAKVDVRSGKTGDLVSAKLREVEGFEHNTDHKEAKEEAEILADGSLVLKVFYSRSEYTVSFDANGGAQKAEQTYKYGQTLELGETSKVGYTFGEWLYQGNQLVYETMPAQNLELVAKWAPNKDTAYTVEHYFEQLDGSYKLDAKVDELEGTTEAKVSAVAREVSGFTHNASHKDALETANVLPDGSLTLKVYYARNTYTLTVNVDGDKEEIEYLFEEEVEALTSPEKTGYTFKAWSPAVPATMPAEDLEVVAQWTINQYTITLDTGEGSYDFTFDYNEKVVIKEPWKYNDSTVQEMLRDFFEDLRHWYLGDLTIDGVVDQNGDSIVFAYVDSTAADKFGDAINNTDEFITKWCSSVVDSWGFFNYGNSETGTGFLNQPAIAAKWSVLTNYMNDLMGGNFWSSAYGACVKFRDYYNGKNSFYNAMNGASYDKVPQQSILTLVKEGYTFKGWSPAIPTTMPAQDLVLTPVWTINQYGISFDLDGGYFTTFDQFVAEIVELFANSDEPNSKVTTKETFHTNSNPNIKGVYNKAENLEAHRWLFEFVKKEINAIDSESSYVIETTEMLDKMIAGDTTAIGSGSYANGRTLFRHFVHNMINKNHESVNSAYTKYVPDFSLAENQEKAFAALNDVVLRFDYQENVTISLIPVKPGYLFKGWNPVAPSTMPAEDVELSAIWEERVIEINYVYENGVWNNKDLQGIKLDSYEKFAEAILADFNEYNGSNYTAEELYGFGKMEQPLGQPTSFLYNNAYNGKWGWILKIIADYTTENNKNACRDFYLCSSLNELKAVNDNHFYAIAYEFRGLVAGLQYTKNASYKTADYSSEEVREAILGYINNNELTYEKAYSDIELKDLISTRDDYMFVGWYSDSEFTNEVTKLAITEGKSEYTLYAKWVNKLENAKSLALTALDEFMKSDEIVKASHYEINNAQLLTEYANQKDLINAADTIEAVEKVLENAKETLLLIAAPIAPTAIHLNAASKTPLVGASLALQLSFEGPEGYKEIVEIVSSNEEIATISNGVVTFLATGTVTITVSSAIDPAIKDSFEFVVGTADMSKVVVSPTATENNVLLYNEQEYFYGVNLFASLSTAVSKVQAGGTVVLTAGVHNLTANLTISKTITILGPNADKTVDEVRNTEAEIAFGTAGLFINAANVKFNGVKLNASGSNTYLSASAEDLTITSCYAYNFNSFLRTDAAIAGGTIRIENNILEKVTQFLLWVKAGHGVKLENVEFNNNIVMGTGTVRSNGMLRITETSASGLKVNVFNNTFNNFASATNFLFRTACGTMTIKFNVFESVSNYFIADSGTIVFEHNLLLDQNSEPQFPETLNGVAIGDSCSSKEDIVDKYNETLGLYTIKYELNGGSFEGNYPKGYDDLEGVELVNPVKAGYNFGGWFDNESLTGDALDVIAAGTGKSLKLYAKWQAIEYTLSFVLNGGSGIFINGNPSTSMDLTAYSNDGGTAGIYICDTSITPSYSLRYQYKILLEYDAELDAYEIVAVDAAKRGIDDAASEEGVVWTHALSSSSSNITTLVNRGQYIVLDSELVLGSPNVAYVYELGQFGTIEDTTFTVESEINLPTPEKEGYTFAGWYDNAEFSGEKVTMISAGTSGNKVYYSKWEEVVYTIEYELNEGLFIFDIEGNRESLIEELLIDLSAFYGKTITTTNFADIIQNTDKAAYYFFESDQTDSNGVTFAQKYGWLRTFIISKRQADASHSSGAAELSNANAQYWRYEMKGFLSGTKSTWPYSADWSNADINSELIALLKTKIPVNSYKITSSTFALANPERTNYNFLGWYSNSSFTGDVIDAIETGTMGNITLYAKWELVLPNANVTYTANFASKTELLDAFLYDFYQFLLDKGTITNAVTFDEFSGRNNNYIGKWFEYQQLDYDPTTGTVFAAAGYTHSANHMILFNKTGVLAKDEAYFFNSTKYGAKWYSFGVWINNSIGTSNRFFTEKYGGCELLRWATGAAGTSYGASFDTGIYMSSLSWTVNYNTESSAIMPTMYKHGSTFAGWLDASSNLYTELPIADPVELTLTPSWE